MKRSSEWSRKRLIALTEELYKEPAYLSIGKYGDYHRCSSARVADRDWMATGFGQTPEQARIDLRIKLDQVAAMCGITLS